MESSQIVMHCPACNRQVKSFKKNCHVLPKWMIKNINQMFSPGRFASADLREKIWHPVQDGLKASLWCNECEQRSADLDSYAARVLTNNAAHTSEYQEVIRSRGFDRDFQNMAVMNFFTLENLDVRKIIWFVYSILIRYELYIKINSNPTILGARFDKLLEIWRKQELEDNDFGIQILRFTESEPGYHSILLYPARIRRNQGRSSEVWFVGAGYCFYIDTSANQATAKQRSAYLLKNRHPIVIGIISATNLKMFDRTLSQLAESKREKAIQLKVSA